MRSAQLITCILLLSCLVTGCKSRTAEEKMMDTSSKILATIQNGDTKAFITYIAVENLRDISKTEEMVQFDIKKYQKLLTQYYGNKAPKIQIMDLYTGLGQRLVKIPLAPRAPNGEAYGEMHLSLLFGPTVYFPLSKISDYELVGNDSDSSNYRPLSFYKNLQRQ